MRARSLAVGAIAAAALALPPLAAPASPPTASAGQPRVHRLEVSLQPRGWAALTFGKVPNGEFRFRVAASSDDAKRFLLTQKRDGGAPFTVLKIPSSQQSACQGAAGTLVCSNIQTPATPAGHSWTFRLTNTSRRATSFTVEIRWRPVSSAG